MREITIEKVIKETTYVAEDGTTFTDKEECKAYERKSPIKVFTFEGYSASLCYIKNEIEFELLLNKLDSFADNIHYTCGFKFEVFGAGWYIYYYDVLKNKYIFNSYNRYLNNLKQRVDDYVQNGKNMIRSMQ